MSMTTQTTAEGDAVGLGRGGRMSRQRKREAVLRLLRGENVELVSRSLGVTAAVLSSWREALRAAGEASRATRPTNGEAWGSDRLKARRWHSRASCKLHIRRTVGGAIHDA